MKTEGAKPPSAVESRGAEFSQLLRKDVSLVYEP